MMLPVLVNGELWQVERVSPDNPLLIDRTGTRTIATTDPETRVIRISSAIEPPLLDKVLLHEVAHAITISYGLLPELRNSIPDNTWVNVEEWSAMLLERHAVEAAILASKSLGRPLCIHGYCMDAL
jgi:hypothetical protein